jgi:hypothetical protein
MRTAAWQSPFQPVAAPFVCPRCGGEVTPHSFWQRVGAMPGRLPAWRLRHRREDGGWCTIYAGPALDAAGDAGCADVA